MIYLLYFTNPNFTFSLVEHCNYSPERTLFRGKKVFLIFMHDTNEQFSVQNFTPASHRHHRIHRKPHRPSMPSMPSSGRRMPSMSSTFHAAYLLPKNKQDSRPLEMLFFVVDLLRLLFD